MEKVNCVLSFFIGKTLKTKKTKMESEIMNKFVNALNNETNKTVTANGAAAFKSTKSYVLDLFALGGSARNADPIALHDMITKAFNENPELAARVVFYLGDIRGGQGFRDLFKAGLKIMVRRYPNIVRKIMRDIPEFTRWDMMYQLEGTALENDMFALLKEVSFNALNKNESHLIFKWLKSKASSDETNRLMRKTARKFDMSEADYRRFIKRGRAPLKLVETLMSTGRSDEIEYSALSSKAALKYREAFKRNDGERFNEFVEAVVKGEATMNMSVAYPHEIVSKYMGGGGYWNESVKAYDASLEAAWKSLEHYFGDGGILNVTDVSGSMLSTISNDSKVTCMDVSVSLGIYTAEHNTGYFKNMFMTFSNRPSLVKLSDKDSLRDKIIRTKSADWGMNTDINAVFKLLLTTATQNRVPQKDLPKTILIVSDMQFDACTNMKSTNYNEWSAKFAQAGYELPQIVFWQVSTESNVPVKVLTPGTAVVSGFSPSILKYIYEGEINTPYDFMLEVVMTERYDRIGEAFRY